MIDYLYVNNYKSLVNCKIKFEHLNVLLGSNGSGKTSVLMVIVLLRDFINSSEELLKIFPKETKTRWMNSGVQTFELGVNIDDKHYSYHLEIEHKEKSCNVVCENVKVDDKYIMNCQRGRVVLYDDNFGIFNEYRSDMTRSGFYFVFEGGQIDYLYKFKMYMASQLILCSPNPKSMFAYINNNVDLAFPDTIFSNIVSVYAYLSQTNTDVIFNLWERMKEINSSFVKTRTDITMFGKTIKTAYRYQDVDVEFLFSELSDGEKMLFSLYLLLYGYIKEGRTVLIDEPDNFLALEEIQPWCIALEEICMEHGQCLMISHHPEVIDYFADDSAIWMSRLNSGESIVTENPFRRKQFERLMKYSELIARGYADENQ